MRRVLERVVATIISDRVRDAAKWFLQLWWPEAGDVWLQPMSSTSP
jgi:hypothetical protein